jgi:hypothetical protein
VGAGVNQAVGRQMAIAVLDHCEASDQSMPDLSLVLSVQNPSQILSVLIYRRQNRPFWAVAFLRRLCQTYRDLDHLVFTEDFSTVIFLQSKVVILASNPQPGGPGLCIYVPQWQGGPVIPPGTGFPFYHLLCLTGFWWTCSSLPVFWFIPELYTHFLVYLDWY